MSKALLLHRKSIASACLLLGLGLMACDRKGGLEQGNPMKAAPSSSPAVDDGLSGDAAGILPGTADSAATTGEPCYDAVQQVIPSQYTNTNVLNPTANYATCYDATGKLVYAANTGTGGLNTGGITVSTTCYDELVATYGSTNIVSQAQAILPNLYNQTMNQGYGQQTFISALQRDTCANLRAQGG